MLTLFIKHFDGGTLHGSAGLTCTGFSCPPPMPPDSCCIVVLTSTRSLCGPAVLEIDALGTFTMSRAAFPALKAAGDSCIINISMTLHYGATWWQTHAAAAKAGVDAMTRSLALEWGTYGIRVNGVAPGPVADTVGMAKLAFLGDKQKEESATRSIPLGKMGSKWDIAQACLFLASPAARWVSGDTLVVDGANWLYKEPVASRDQLAKIGRSLEQRKSKQTDAKSKL